MKIINHFIAKIWKLLSGSLQWHILWFTHDKFILGVSGVIFNEKNQVLLLKHRFWTEDSWGLPSGYAKRGESLEEALVREVNEETGYSVSILGLLQLVSGYKLRLETSYLGHLIGGNLEISQREIIEARFFELEELPDGLLDSHRELINLTSQNIGGVKPMTLSL